MDSDDADILAGRTMKNAPMKLAHPSRNEILAVRWARMLFSCIVTVGLMSQAWAQSSVREENATPRDEPHLFQSFSPERWDRSSFAPPGSIDWWTKARFGIFLHLGVSSLEGVELGWGRHTRIAPDQGVGPIPDAVYDNLYKRFALAKFDAKEWIRIAKDAGAGYIVVITKHHDGFHMWDTALSDYKITNALFGRDYVKEVVEAAHAAKMPIGLYFSQRDWYHPQYDPRGTDPKRDHRKYIDYEFKAVRELLTKYGKIDIFWLDAAWWGGMFKEEDWDSERLYRMIRELQPGIIINNRASIPGDFDTPEQHIGAFQNNRPWESALTMLSNNQWAYSPNTPLKPLKTVIGFMVSAATGDGNILLNVGPRADGTIQPSEVEQLKKMGEWFRQYGQTIYGTRGGPYLNGVWGGTTHKSDRFWVHIINGQERILLPPLPFKVKSWRTIAGNGAQVSSTAEAFTVTVPKASHDPIDTIVEVVVAGSIPPQMVLGGAREPDTAKYGELLGSWRPEAWSIVDLGAIHRVTAVAINAANGGLAGTEIEISADKANWTKVSSENGNESRWVVPVRYMQSGVAVAGMSVRYVRVRSQTALRSIDVFGDDKLGN